MCSAKSAGRDRHRDQKQRGHQDPPLPAQSRAGCGCRGWWRTAGCRAGSRARRAGGSQRFRSSSSTTKPSPAPMPAADPGAGDQHPVRLLGRGRRHRRLDQREALALRHHLDALADRRLRQARHGRVVLALGVGVVALEPGRAPARWPGVALIEASSSASCGLDAGPLVGDELRAARRSRRAGCRAPTCPRGRPLERPLLVDDLLERGDPGLEQADVGVASASRSPGRRASWRRSCSRSCSSWVPGASASGEPGRSARRSRSPARGCP